MHHLIKRADKYYFSRRVPKAFKEYDPRSYIRIALKTDSKQVAIKAAIARNEELEAYWATLIKTGSIYSSESYTALVDRARLLGFAYYYAPDVAQLPFPQIMERFEHLKKHNLNKEHVEAILGNAPTPSIQLSDCLNRFWGYAKNKILNKSPDQIRKWRNPRVKAMKNFIKVVGDKMVTEVTRDDALKFRDWWIERLENEGLISGSANKDIIYVKTIIES
ncbi:MAG: DUF6538 domain-containing protein, partial [Bacteroidota bacterium]